MTSSQNGAAGLTIGLGGLGVALLSGVIAGNLAAALVSTVSDEMLFQVLAGICVGFGLIVALAQSSQAIWIMAIFPLTGAGLLAAGFFHLTETDGGGNATVADSMLAGLLAAALAAGIAALWAKLFTKSWRVSTLRTLTPWKGAWALAFAGVAIAIGIASLTSVGSFGWVAFGTAALATSSAVLFAGSSKQIATLVWVAATGVFALAGIVLLMIA